jgi:hypothetical protein
MGTFSVIFSVVLLLSASYSQDVKKHSTPPRNPDAGRELKLEKVFEIKDDSGKFYLTGPRKLAMDSQDCLYILEDDQILKFASDGTFIANLFKKGQGPGEISTRYFMISFFTHEDEIYIYDGVAKIIHLDADGNLIHEVKQTAGRFYKIIGRSENAYFFLGQTPIPRGKKGYYEIDDLIYKVSLDGTSAELIRSFPKKIYRGEKVVSEWDRSFYAFTQDKGLLWASHQAEYQIHKVDLLDPKVNLGWRLEYPRQKWRMPESQKELYQKYDLPKKKYENDIVGLYVNQDDVWVMTSTIDKEKGTRFDVIHTSFSYEDSFYLKLDGKLELVKNDCIFVTERDSEENVSINKYRILN